MPRYCGIESAVNKAGLLRMKGEECKNGEELLDGMGPDVRERFQEAALS